MSDLINFQALIIQSINLAIVVFVLYRFLLKPYLAVLDEEAKKSKEIDTLHTEMELEKKRSLEEAKSIREEAKKEAKHIREEQKNIARTEAAEIIARAQEESEALRNKGLNDVENERKSMEKEMEHRITSIALKLNEKLFGENEANKAFITRHLK